jgi:multiple sugar transport system permease protein
MRRLEGSRSREARRTTVRPSIEAGLFLSPAFLVLGVFVLVPAAYVFVLSLFRWDLISSTPLFTGFGNYAHLTKDPVWWQSLGQTVYFVVGTVPTGMVLGLGLALLLEGRLPGRSVIRGAIFVPYVTPAVATIVIWEWIFNADYGLLNAILKAVHLHGVGWLIDSRAIMPAVIIYTLWSTTGFNLVIFLAGLTNIPSELKDAARVDGAKPWQSFWRVTWPLLTPTTFFVLVISSINSFKVFNSVFVLTNGTGGPGQAALTVGFYLYEQAFEFFRAGYASAISVVLLGIVVVITLMQLRLGSRRVFYR